MRFWCPCGCRVHGKTPHWLPLTKGAHVPNSHRWGWDGNVERPSLTPSLQMLTPCQWHGHLVSGEWKRV